MDDDTPTIKSVLFRPPGSCQNTDKEENRKMREKIGQTGQAEWESKQTPKELQIITEGKTKTLESITNTSLVRITTKDSLTANDGEKLTILNKVAEYKTTQTCNVFELLAKRGIPVAYQEREGLKTFLAQKCRMIPMECVTRRQPYGSYIKRYPDKSTREIFNPLLTEFFHKYTVVMPCTIHRNMHAISTEPRLVPEDKAREWFTDKDTKKWNHEVYTDPLINISDTDEKIWELHPAKIPRWLNAAHDPPIMTIIAAMSDKTVVEIQTLMRKVFIILEDVWKLCQVSLIDMKIEVGYQEKDNQLVVADVIDNDSWRIWPYGDPKKQLDKQSFRDGEEDDAVVEKYRVVAEYTKKF